MATASAPRRQLDNPQQLSAVPNRKKFVRLTLWPLVAATFLYGVGRNLWHRRHRAWRRLRTRDPDSAAHPAALEPAYGLHDRRAVERAAFRRRLLRLGAPRHGQLLGISGSLALARCLHLRHGDLSHPVRRLPDPHVPVVSGRQSRMVGCSRRRRRLRPAQHRRREGGFAHFPLVVPRLVGAVRRHRRARSVQARRLGKRRHQAHYLNRGYSRRPAHLHVELHGMGQRLDHRNRSRAPAADLPASDAGRRLHRRRQLHSALRRHVDDRPEAHSMGNRIVG